MEKHTVSKLLVAKQIMPGGDSAQAGSNRIGMTACDLQCAEAQRPAYGVVNNSGAIDTLRQS